MTSRAARRKLEDPYEDHITYARSMLTDWSAYMVRFVPPTLSQVREIVHTVINDERVISTYVKCEPLTVKGHSSTGKALHAQAEIQLSIHDRQPPVVLHEIAHHLTWRTYKRRRLYTHGPEFAGTWLDLLYWFHDPKKASAVEQYLSAHMPITKKEMSHG